MLEFMDILKTAKLLFLLLFAAAASIAHGSTYPPKLFILWMSTLLAIVFDTQFVNLVLYVCARAFATLSTNCAIM